MLPRSDPRRCGTIATSVPNGMSVGGVRPSGWNAAGQIALFLSCRAILEKTPQAARFRRGPSAITGAVVGVILNVAIW
jgi:hypothetical protein